MPIIIRMQKWRRLFMFIVLVIILKMEIFSRIKTCPVPTPVSSVDQNEDTETRALYRQMSRRYFMNIDPEIFHVLPTTFLPQYKNPCFYKKNMSDLYCLPYFYIVGMAKCGTSDVWDKIISHPDVIDVPKEPNWWGLRRFRSDVFTKDRKVPEVLKMPGSRSLNSIFFYLNWFKKYAGPFFQEENALQSQKVFGDGSISTATGISGRWRKHNPQAEEPAYVSADLLNAVQPNAKIIIMVRNTTEWAMSWFRFALGGKTSEAFNTTMLRLIECVNRCLDVHTERFCAYVDSCGREVHFPIRDIHIGIYHWFIKDWIRVYSRQRIMIIRLEDWKTKKASVYRNILRYLQLRQLPEEEENVILGMRTKNAIPKKFPLLPETHIALENFFKPHNYKLAELLNDTSFYEYS